MGAISTLKNLERLTIYGSIYLEGSDLQIGLPNLKSLEIWENKDVRDIINSVKNIESIENIHIVHSSFVKEALQDIIELSPEIIQEFDSDTRDGYVNLTSKTKLGSDGNPLPKNLKAIQVSSKYDSYYRELSIYINPDSTTEETHGQLPQKV